MRPRGGQVGGRRPTGLRDASAICPRALASGTDPGCAGEIADLLGESQGLHLGAIVPAYRSAAREVLTRR